MNLLWHFCVTLFTLGAAFMILYLRSHQDSIKIWRIRRAHRLEREAYIREHGAALMESMRHHQLTVYVDAELDEAHLEGHLFLFNDHFAEKLIRQFCLPRWWLVTQLCRESISIIFPYLYYLMRPRVDRQTRPRQRALIREREQAAQQ